mmetsp:Transcript_10414/g.33660  ORF Transcript_10414/g.33660 Transcript_10414/m.33660 type:complete len:328 (+) Transcript_10414:830-1813(+)
MVPGGGPRPNVEAVATQEHDGCGEQAHDQIHPHEVRHPGEVRLMVMVVVLLREPVIVLIDIDTRGGVRVGVEMHLPILADVYVEVGRDGGEGRRGRRRRILEDIFHQRVMREGDAAEDLHDDEEREGEHARDDDQALPHPHLLGAVIVAVPGIRLPRARLEPQVLYHAQDVAHAHHVWLELQPGALHCVVDRHPPHPRDLANRLLDPGGAGGAHHALHHERRHAGLLRDRGGRLEAHVVDLVGQELVPAIHVHPVGDQGGVHLHCRRVGKQAHVHRLDRVDLAEHVLYAPRARRARHPLDLECECLGPGSGGAPLGTLSTQLGEMEV